MTMFLAITITDVVIDRFFRSSIFVGRCAGDEKWEKTEQDKPQKGYKQRPCPEQHFFLLNSAIEETAFPLSGLRSSSNGRRIIPSLVQLKRIVS